MRNKVSQYNSVPAEDIYKKSKKTNQTEFSIENVTKRKGDKLYVKWKGYDNSFNSWIDTKHIAIQNELFS